MRTFFGIILGIALTVGAAFLHDNNVAADPADPVLTNRQIVNWEVLGAVVHQMTDTISGLWDRVTGK